MDWLSDRVRGPGGVYRMAVTSRGLLALSHPGTTAAAFRNDVEGLLQRAGFAPPGEAEAHLEQFRDLVAEWDGDTAWHCHYFPPALDLRGSAFQRKVWDTLRKLPPGETLTYGELAERSGAPRAARAVGSAMRRNAVALFVPCHRVVGANGLGSFGQVGLRRKRMLLKLESAVVKPEKVS